MYRKEIRYDRETRDYAMYLDGDLKGFAPNYSQAENDLNAMVLDLCEQGLLDTPLAALDDPAQAYVNVQEAYADALARLAATGRTEADAVALIALNLGCRARPAWYDLAWEVVSCKGQLAEMAPHPAPPFTDEQAQSAAAELDVSLDIAAQLRALNERCMCDGWTDADEALRRELAAQEIAAVHRAREALDPPGAPYPPQGDDDNPDPDPAPGRRLVFAYAAIPCKGCRKAIISDEGAYCPECAVNDDDWARIRASRRHSLRLLQKIIDAADASCESYASV